MIQKWYEQHSHIIRPEYFFWAATLCSFFFLISAPNPTVPSTAVAAVGGVTAPKENPFDSVSLSAKAAYVYDVKAGKPLFAKNEDEVLPLASVTKIMTAATALSFLPETTYITIDAEAIRAEGNSGLTVGERWLL